MSSPCAPTRTSKVLVLVALLHYLNACPCGCLEHHALYQTVLAAYGGGDHPVDEPLGTSPLDVESDHCDGPCDIVFATSKGEVRTADILSTMLLATDMGVVPTWPTPLQADLKARSSANSALGVCADLQVMLI